MSQMALCVRFTLREGAGEAFDELVREAGAAVRTQEPGTLVYACCEVEGASNQRLFFELYADRAAFDEHGSQPHVRHFLSECEKYAERTEIDRLRPYSGKYPSGIPVKARLPGRVDPGPTSYGSVTELASALRRAAAAHGEHEKRIGQEDPNWPDWYARFMVDEQTGAAPPE
ncbi:putative quinol monooxygenase [Streptomyces olivochromogenes]|uniref:putative quinol monooxygenase n=1 Tax=Streptomyces olivochromogenes TaxID=1963 RepID=UPI001F4133BA|nr:antibiotic biosynthesis monooxygenase [Streptomyces olivochromogenes]